MRMLLLHQPAETVVTTPPQALGHDPTKTSKTKKSAETVVTTPPQALGHDPTKTSKTKKSAETVVTTPPQALGHDPTKTSKTKKSAGSFLVIDPRALGHDPTKVLCPKCKKKIVSKVEYTQGSCTWLACALIFIFGGPCFCCLIPFCVDSCKDAIHSCPQCGRYLGMSKQL
ncbi:hypothetical protein SprV_0301064300 [Sparganum proliferum]